MTTLAKSRLTTTTRKTTTARKRILEFGLESLER